MINQSSRQGAGFLPYLPFGVVQENAVVFLHVLQQSTPREVKHRPVGCDAELAAAERRQRERCPLIAYRAVTLRLTDVNPLLHLQGTRPKRPSDCASSGATVVSGLFALW